jgi:hypothetical protein
MLTTKNKTILLKIAVILMVAFLLFIMFWLIVPHADGRLKAYSSGDAIYYNDRLFIGTTDTGKFELLVWDNNRLVKSASLLSQDFKKQDFYDVMFNIENGRLFAYLVNDYLLKYDLSDPNFPILTLKIKDNSLDNFYGLTRVGDKIATIGTKGLKVWNYDYQVSHAYAVIPKNKRNIVFSPQGNFLFTDDEGIFKFIDTRSMQTKTASAFYSANEHSRAMLNDESLGVVFMVDDEALKKVYFDGTAQAHKHISTIGYDVASVAGADYIYFTDGVGIVKAMKEDLQFIDWAYTDQIGAEGGWAMGLKAIATPRGDRIVVFNGANIVLFDKDLNMLDYFSATETDYAPIESLHLELSSYQGFPRQAVLVTGKGYGVYEKLRVSLAGVDFSAEADKDGSFSRMIIIPSVLPNRYDIKVDGLSTNLTYSTSFQIY